MWWTDDRLVDHIIICTFCHLLGACVSARVYSECVQQRQSDVYKGNIDINVQEFQSEYIGLYFNGRTGHDMYWVGHFTAENLLFLINKHHFSWKYLADLLPRVWSPSWWVWTGLSTCSSSSGAPSSVRRLLWVCGSYERWPPPPPVAGWSWGYAAGRQSSHLRCLGRHKTTKLKQIHNKACVESPSELLASVKLVIY